MLQEVAPSRASFGPESEPELARGAAEVYFFDLLEKEGGREAASRIAMEETGILQQEAVRALLAKFYQFSDPDLFAHLVEVVADMALATCKAQPNHSTTRSALLV